MNPLRVVMMGTGTFAEPNFEQLLRCSDVQVVGLVTQPEKNAGRRGGSTRQTGLGMGNIAQQHQIPVFQPNSINSVDAIAQLTLWQPELFVVAAYGQILKPAVINIPKFGAINVHASLLPKYRGASPVAHALLAGETETGVTIIQISPGLDAGQMLDQVKTNINAEETTGELEFRLARLGAELLPRVLDRIRRGELQPIPQDERAVTRAPKIAKEAGLINWQATAHEIHCLVRAMQPWPTAYSFLQRLDKEPLRVIITKLASSGPVPRSVAEEKLTPGVINISSDQRLWVGTGDHPVELLELQPAGKKKMTASDFLRGQDLTQAQFVSPKSPE